MSAPEDSLPESTPDQQTPRRCRVRYRVRWFSSKGAFLILLWTFLICIAFGKKTWNEIINTSTLLFKEVEVLNFLVLFTVVIVSAVLSGWLADGVLGKYRVVKMGMVLLFLTLVLLGVIELFLPLWDSLLTVSLVIKLFSVASMVTVTVNLFQLGLDQMPDASSNNITSYIAWFVFCTLSGLWVNYITLILNKDIKADYEVILMLFPVLCVSIVLCSDFLLTPKWLIKEPKSPHSLKVIYRVLRYAKKHKSPVNRSALTYWEEDLPSRIDLGKSKYGGPFTTEQVENVKTFLRILVVSMPMWVIIMTALQNGPISFRSSTSNTPAALISNSSASPLLALNNIYGWGAVGTLVYEFSVYPFLPSILILSSLKRIGAMLFITFLISIAFLIMSILRDYNSSVENSFGLSMVETVIGGVIVSFAAPAILEFVCAQSPQDMRGLLNGYMFSILLLSGVIGAIIINIFARVCFGKYCKTGYYTLASIVSLVGLVSHILLSRWYKRRKREDVIATQQWVEEVYDRYLSTNADPKRSTVPLSYNDPL